MKLNTHKSQVTNPIPLPAPSSDMLASYARETGIPTVHLYCCRPLEERISLREVFNRGGGDGWNGRVWLLPGVDQRGELIKLAALHRLD